MRRKNVYRHLPASVLLCVLWACGTGSDPCEITIDLDYGYDEIYLFNSSCNCYELDTADYNETFAIEFKGEQKVSDSDELTSEFLSDFTRIYLETNNPDTTLVLWRRTLTDEREMKTFDDVLDVEYRKVDSLTPEAEHDSTQLLVITEEGLKRWSRWWVDIFQIRKSYLGFTSINVQADVAKDTIRITGDTLHRFSSGNSHFSISGILSDSYCQ